MLNDPTPLSICEFHPTSTGAELLITPGFDVPLFVAAAAFGAGRLYVNGMRAQNVTLQMSG